MKICVTGHRPDKLFGYALSDIRYLYMKLFFKQFLIEKQCTDAWTGMALGADMVFALAVIDLKDEGYDIKLHCAIPCKGHTNKWQKYPELIAIYNYILSRADEKVIIKDGFYDEFCMQERNMYMVDRIDEVLAIWNGSSGGTKNCVDYANRVGKPVNVVHPLDAIR